MSSEGKLALAQTSAKSGKPVCCFSFKLVETLGLDRPGDRGGTLTILRPAEDAMVEKGEVPHVVEWEGSWKWRIVR